MDEQTIAARVAQNIKTEPHIPAPAPTTPAEPLPSAFDSNVALNDPALGLQLADYFDLGRLEIHNEEFQRQMRSVYQWAAEIAQSTELDKVMSVVRVLENELGATWASDRLQRLAKWVKLNQQAKVLSLQLEALRG